MGRQSIFGRRIPDQPRPRPGSGQRRGQRQPDSADSQHRTLVGGGRGEQWQPPRRDARDRRPRARIVRSDGPMSIDPAFYSFANNPQFTGLEYDSLVNLQQSAGAAGLRLVPDLALSIPTPDRKS